MPFPKEWQSKPVVPAYPFSANGTIVCHNCYVSWAKQYINPCTGLCVKCKEENPVAIREVQEKSPGMHQEHECYKCLQPLKRRNFGINRDICDSCKAHHPLRQRCLACNKYYDDCWNNVCSKCRVIAEIFCENVGHFYSSSRDHDKECWCVDRGTLLSRQGSP